MAEVLGKFIENYNEFLYPVAEIAASTLELIGIIIIVIGSVRALYLLINCLFKKIPFHVGIELGKALSLALEFKMGAEIIKTVVVHNLEELAILGVVILIRALLAFIVHWEISNERKNELKEKAEKDEKE